MDIDININSNVAAYLQIENHVKFAIASNKVKPGDQLPTVKELSEKLKVNPNTVAKSYRDLEVMEYVYTRRGRGVFVNHGIEQKCREETYKELIGKIYEVVSEAKAAGMTNSDIDAIAKTSMKHAGVPYSAAPDAVLSLAKKKSK